tara:strand:+ start:5885 stop:6475 length:591 start_codon:yes stop_codon:yes gene_type:complete
MGSGISKKNTGQLVCPEGYDKEKFKQILYLYDKLDTNGDMVIEKEELFILTEHHIKNKQKILEKDKIIVENTKNQKLLAISLEYESLKKNLEKEYLKKKEKYENTEKEKKKEIDNTILSLNHLTKSQKYEIFKQKFCDNDNKLEFKLFFEYMKDKTEDIENINWKTTGKLDHLFLPKNPTIEISSPNNKPRLLSSP